MRGGQEGEHEGVGVPEHVAAVSHAGQTTSADRGLTAVRDRCHQVEQREADAQLQLVISVDDHVGVLPPACPGPAVLGKQPVEADSGSSTDGVDGRGGVGEGVGIGVVDGHAIEDPAAGVCSLHRVGPAGTGLYGRRRDPASGSGDPDPRCLAGAAGIVGCIVGRR